MFWTYLLQAPQSSGRSRAGAPCLTVRTTWHSIGYEKPSEKPSEVSRVISSNIVLPNSSGNWRMAFWVVLSITWSSMILCEYPKFGRSVVERGQHVTDLPLGGMGAVLLLPQKQGRGIKQLNIALPQRPTPTFPQNQSFCKKFLDPKLFHQMMIADKLWKYW